MYNYEDIEELREQQRRRNKKYIRIEPCRGYDDDDEDDHDIYPEDRYVG